MKIVKESLEERCEKIVLNLECKNPKCQAKVEVYASDLRLRKAGYISITAPSVICPFCKRGICVERGEMAPEIYNYIKRLPSTDHSNDLDVRNAFYEAFCYQ